MSTAQQLRRAPTAWPVAAPCARPVPVKCRTQTFHRCLTIASAAAVAPQKYAVIGAGLAGLATAYHLLDAAPIGQPVEVTVVDAVGIGAGGSGAAAGLLHPFTPKGKPLWRADDAMREAMRLLAVAEAAAAAAGEAQPVAWRHGMLRPSAHLKQAAAYRRAWEGAGGAKQGTCSTSDMPGDAATAAAAASMQAQCLMPEQAVSLLPGVRLPAVEEAAAVAASDGDSSSGGGGPNTLRRQQRGKQRGPSPEDATACAALHIPGGATLHPARYMDALWEACRARAAARGDGSAALLEVQRLRSVAELHAGPGGPYAGGVVVAAGAAVGALEEFGEVALPLDLCQGYTLDLAPPGASGEQQQQHGTAAAAGYYPAQAPSLLGSPYIASQGGDLLVVGATKAHGWGAQRALAECGRRVDAVAHAAAFEAAAADLAARGGAAGGVLSDDEDGRSSSSGGSSISQDVSSVDDDAPGVAAAVRELLAGGSAAWPPLLRARLAGIRTGVRALPPRTPAGAVPLMGRWPADNAGSSSSSSGGGGGSNSSGGSPPTWLLVGLGARGLVYHAWLGRCAALAALGEGEAALPPETLAWRSVAAAARGGAIQ